MEDVAPVPAHDNRRIFGGSCPGIIDGTRWLSRWSSIIIPLGIFQVSVRLSILNAGALNTRHAYTPLSTVWWVQKKGCACLGAMGVQPGQ
jgi:hypothetical protein